MTLTDSDDAQASLWALIADLSQQLNTNRAHVTALQNQLSTLKGKSVHSNTGYALRRFNVDVSREKFESELEKWNVALITENNELRWENKMNDKLLKEYEQCLEVIMHKFRSFAHSSSVHALKLTQYYEDLIASRNHEEKERELGTSVAITNTLSHLGTLVRSALREVEGERSDDDGELEEDEEATTSHAPRTAYGSTDPRWYGSGGYTGKHGDPEAQRSDHALERAVELQRLRFENEELRRVLDLSQGKGLDVGFGKEKLSLGVPRGRRGVSTQQQQQHQPEPPTTRVEDHSLLPAIPNAPLPTASISLPSTTPTPPPPPRATLQERMTQVLRGAVGVGSPAQPVATASEPVEEQPQPPLISTPVDSAPAQSDIRGSPALTLVDAKEEEEAGEDEHTAAKEGEVDAQDVPDDTAAAVGVDAELADESAVDVEEAAEAEEEGKESPAVEEPAAGAAE